MFALVGNERLRLIAQTALSVLPRLFQTLRQKKMISPSKKPIDQI